MEKKSEITRITGAGNNGSKIFQLFKNKCFAKKAEVVVFVTEDNDPPKIANEIKAFSGKTAAILNFENGEPTHTSLARVLAKILHGGIVVLHPQDLSRQVVKKTEIIAVDKKTKLMDFLNKLAIAGYATAKDAKNIEEGEFTRVGEIVKIWSVGNDEILTLTWDFDECDTEILIPHTNVSGEIPLHKKIPKNALVVLDEIEEKAVEIIQIESKKCGWQIVEFLAFTDNENETKTERFCSVLRYASLHEVYLDVMKRRDLGWSVVIASDRADEIEKLMTDKNVDFTIEDVPKNGVVDLISK